MTAVDSLKKLISACAQQDLSKSLHFFDSNCTLIRVSTNSPFGRPLKARNPRDLSLLRFKEFSLIAKEFAVC